MIKCTDIHKQFNGKEVLSGINIEIPDGNIFGLLGPSGAGKTTLIKIITGQLEFEKGSVTILDKNVDELTGSDRRNIGIMMDRFGLYERFSCIDNLKVFADIYGVPYSKIKETLELVGLGDSMKKSASNLSKGMWVRLNLARVFMISPKVIFLDEPTSGLDPQTSKQIRKIILDKKNSGCTVFLTTHNMEEAYELCDTVALLNEGVIAECGNPQEICRKYNHQKRINLHLSSGEDMELGQDEKAAERVFELLKTGRVETIHSSEPTLETVFLELTGRNLQEGA